MEPNIKVYDTVVTMTTDPKNIKVNDVISFISTSSISRGLLVTHRVINIVNASNGELAFQTKGDNNLTADSSVAMASNIIGKVIFIATAIKDVAVVTPK
jgi:signal peptidase